jgi:ribosomal protein S27AE
MKQKKQIVFEVEETVVLRDKETSITAVCPFCGKSVVMATPWVTATLTAATEREIFRLVERGAIFVTEGGRILMCLRCAGRVSVGTSYPPTDIEPINREPDLLIGPFGNEEV